MKNNSIESAIEGIVMTPTQLNEVIMEKLDLLTPKLIALRDIMMSFQKEVLNENESAFWEDFFQKTKLKNITTICEEMHVH